MKELIGTPVSTGIAIGKAFLFIEDEFPEIPRWTIHKARVEAEWKRFTEAAHGISTTMRALIKRTEREKNKEQSEILHAHLMMLEDADFQEQVRGRLEKDRQNIEWIVWKVSHNITQKLLAAPSAYLRERAVDIADMSHQLLSRLLSITRGSLADLSEDVIVVSHDLMPSQTLGMNKTHVKALIMDAGSATSHTAILARSFDIPAVLGLSTCTKEINAGDTLIVDGNAGKVIINPDPETLSEYTSALIHFEKLSLENFTLGDLPAETRDGKRFRLMANIELPSEAGKAFKFGAEGIGLFRSEFLFLAADGVTDEENQFAAYRNVIETAGGKPVKIRTSDVGGDKMLASLFPKKEKNPLLGWRAIRFSLAMPEIFKAQLRAILRAAAFGNAEIIFPLISCIEEFEQALALLEEAKADCRKNGQPIAESIKTGVMIEVPSAAVGAGILAKKAGFFSIGTNDLVQYTLAVDRGNEKVNYLANTLHPAVLRLIKTAIDAAHEAGITTAMCGEMAGIPRYAALLAGLGLDEFSMSASSIPEVKRALRSVTHAGCTQLAVAALACSRHEEITRLLDEFS
jgi:phosphotransferase system enzyme I (PtsI)